MYYLSRLVNATKNAALIGLMLYAVNPFSIFLIAGYSESTYVLISAITLILLVKKKYIPAVLVGGFLSGIRSIGIFFTLIFIVYYFFIEKNKINVTNVLKVFGLSALSVWGKVAFMLYNYVRLNEVFASEIVQKYWGNIGGDLTLKEQIINLIKYILIPVKNRFNPLSPSVVSILNVHLLLIISLICIAGIIIRYKNKDCKWLDSLYGSVLNIKDEVLLLTWSLVQIILPLIIFGTKGNNPFSMGRYILPMFPIYILLGNLIEKRNLIYSLLLCIFIFEMIILALGFSFGLERNVYVF